MSALHPTFDALLKPFAPAEAPTVRTPVPTAAWCRAKERFVVALADPGAMFGSRRSPVEPVREWVMDALISLRPGDAAERAQDTIIRLLVRAADDGDAGAVAAIDAIATQAADYSAVECDDVDPDEPDYDRMHDEDVDRRLRSYLGEVA